MNQAAFWDKMADKYAASPIKDMKAYTYTLDRTRSYLNAADKVLEIGCGTGSTALALAGEGTAVTGTDISAEMIRIAAEKAAVQEVQGANFKVAHALESAQEAGGYDVVMGFNILHLTTDLEAILRTLAQKMKPGSLLITKTPCLGEPSIGIKRFAFGALVPVLQMIGKAPFVRSLSFQQLEKMMEDVGFQIVETGSKPAMTRYIVARKL